jgi:hypothetical protein
MSGREHSFRGFAKAKVYVRVVVIAFSKLLTLTKVGGFSEDTM